MFEIFNIWYYYTNNVKEKIFGDHNYSIIPESMKTIKVILYVIIAFLVLIIIIYAYYAGFKKVVFQTSEQGGETLVYEELTGDYNQSGVVMDRIYNSLLKDEKIETFKGFGIYYDNPQEVEKSKLRSAVGCILEKRDSAKLNELKKKYKIETCPTGKYITTEFPFKGKMSVMLGIMKVYPAMSKYIKEKGLNEKGAVMEIYDTPNKKILYRKEIVAE
jgi:DNA gyrase inhibitor GyrI